MRLKTNVFVWLGGTGELYYLTFVFELLLKSYISLQSTLFKALKTIFEFFKLCWIFLCSCNQLKRPPECLLYESSKFKSDFEAFKLCSIEVISHLN